MELLPPEIGTELLRNLERNLVAGGWVERIESIRITIYWNWPQGLPTLQEFR